MQNLKRPWILTKIHGGGGKILIISDLLYFILLDFYKDTRYTVMAICKRPCTLYFDATLSWHFAFPNHLSYIQRIRLSINNVPVFLNLLNCYTVFHAWTKLSFVNWKLSFVSFPAFQHIKNCLSLVWTKDNWFYLQQLIICHIFVQYERFFSNLSLPLSARKTAVRHPI